MAITENNLDWPVKSKYYTSNTIKVKMQNPKKKENKI